MKRYKPKTGKAEEKTIRACKNTENMAVKYYRLVVCGLTKPLPILSF